MWSYDVFLLWPNDIFLYVNYVDINQNTTLLQFLGLLDYIRTFTWDKKVEMLVKAAYGE